MLVKEKVDQAKRLLVEFDIDCWITFVRESQINGDPTMAFLAGSNVTWHSAFIVNRDGSTKAIVGRYDVMTVQETGAWDDVIGFVTGIRDPLSAYLKELNPRSIGINFSEGSEICDGITHGMYLTLSAILADIGMAGRIVSAERIVSALRERKSPTEIAIIRRAIRHTEEIFELVAGFIRPGLTEKEIAAFMKAEVERRKIGFGWDAAVCPAVFTGPEGAEAHFAPTEKKVARGHILNMDFGIRVDGYVSDMQRTFYVLQKGETAAPTEVQRGFDTIVAAIEQSKQAMKPGIEGREIDAISRRVLKEHGYEEFPHGLGHQVGRFSHDGTALLGPAWEKYAEKPFRLLEPGMIFTIEPRLTVPERGICTIEEMVLVTDKGCEWLSQPQKELILIK